MNIILFFSLFAFAVVFCIANKNSIKLYLKNSLLPILAIFVTAMLIIYPRAAVSSALSGINLWLNIVFPSLFPFFVASHLLNKSGFVNLFGTILEPVMRPIFNIPGCGSFAFIMGIVSGYPMGAAITADLREQRLISKTEGERLLTFTNNSGPLFIMGAVAVGMLKSPAAGYLLYASHVAACITVGILFGYYKKSKRDKRNFLGVSERVKIELQRLRNSDINPWTLFGEAIKNSIFTILNIGGFIIFFSVFINILLTSGIISWISGLLPVTLAKIGLETKAIEGILCGIFEITTGSNIINLAAMEFKIKLAAISFIIGWAGLSVHAQVMSIVSKTDISVKPYILGKALQGGFSAIYTFLGFSLFSSYLFKDSPTFSHQLSSMKNNLESIFATSVHTAAFISLIMLLFSAAYLCIVHFFAKKRLF